MAYYTDPNYPEFPGGRDPFAKSSYAEEMEARRRKRQADVRRNMKSIQAAFVAFLALLLCFNIVWVLWSSGKLGDIEKIESLIKIEPDEKPFHGGYWADTSHTDVTVPTEPPVVNVNTAFGKVMPAFGDYASVIDRFISQERMMMKQDEVVLTFTGDCTLGTWPSSSRLTNYNTIFEASGSPTYSFDNVKSFFFNDDYTYINLETTLTTATKASDQTYAFKGDPAWASGMIAASGIEGCNIANNHHYDWLEQGYTDTINSVTGAGMDVGNEDHVIVTECGDLEVVLISGNFIWPTGRGQVIDGGKLTDTLCAQVKQYKRPDNIVIVSAHWGLERQNFCNYEQYDPARAFIDAGADLVVGHHPHTLQGVEVYNGKYIFYSLGNFAFGGKATTDEVNRVSIMLRPRFALRGGVAEMTGLCIVPCYTTSADDIAVNNYQPHPLVGAEAQKLADDLLKYSAGLKYGLKESLSCPTASFK